MTHDNTKLDLGVIFLLASILLLGCETSHHPEPLTTRTTYHSLEDALNNPDFAETLFLNDIGDSLSPDIGNLPVLSHLYISNSDIEYLPEELVNRDFMLTIWIRNCRLWHIPRQLLELDILSGLNLNGNDIEDIPAGFNRQTELEYLSLRSNRISRIERSSLNLKKCLSLRLDSNRLVDFDFTMSDFPNLMELTLSGNMLSDSVKSQIRQEFTSLNILLL